MIAQPTGIEPAAVLDSLRPLAVAGCDACRSVPPGRMVGARFSRPRRPITRWTRCFAEESFALYWPELQRWWLASVAFGPALGAVGACVGRAGARGLLAGLVVPVGALVQMVVLPPGSGNLIVTPEMRLAWAIVLVGSGVVAGAVLVRFVAERRR